MRLVSQSKHNNAPEIGWWVSEDIRKVQVERDESTILMATNVDHALVRLATKGLLNNRMSVMPGVDKHRQQ
jgi:hypothetical protein